MAKSELLITKFLSNWTFRNKKRNGQEYKTHASKILGATTSYLGARVTWCPRFIEPLYRDTRPNQSFKNSTNSIVHQVTTTVTNVQATRTLENKEFGKYLLLHSKALSTPLPKTLHVQNRQINIATWFVHVWNKVSRFESTVILLPAKHNYTHLVHFIFIPVSE